MKIEKINDNQVKIMLSNIDLAERNLRIDELAYGSEKAQALFRDIMAEAQIQYGFEAENLPLMIEAIPYSRDSITIIVTKVTNPPDLEERFKYFQNKFQSDIHHHENIVSNAPNTPNPIQKAIPPEPMPSPVLVFSFDTLDKAALAATEVCKRLPSELPLIDILFKHGNLYYLYIELPRPNPALALTILSTACEFGQRHEISQYSKHYLLEHGTVLIKDEALRKLTISLGD